MKIDPRHIRFLAPLPWPTRRRVILHGRGNTMHLLETALVIEGYRQRLFFPVVDRFLRLALSEWTTVTVPYSRIVRFTHERRLVARGLALLGVWAPVTPALVLTAGELLTAPQAAGEEIPALLAMFLGALVLSGLLLYLLRPRNSLVYRQADGKRALVVFRIASRKRQKAFAALLERNRETARGRLEGRSR
jgi:hypothetical protein